MVKDADQDADKEADQNFDQYAIFCRHSQHSAQLCVCYSILHELP